MIVYHQGEEFHEIPNVPFGYFASHSGEILSVLNNRHLIKKSYITPHGYRRMRLTARPHYNKMHLVHRLILETFLERPEGKNFCNHKDGDKTNNRLENLEWVNHSENELHKRRVLKKLGTSKITEEDVLEIRKSKMRQVDLAKKYGVTKSCICSIINGHTWKYLI